MRMEVQLVASKNVSKSSQNDCALNKMCMFLLNEKMSPNVSWKNCHSLHRKKSQKVGNSFHLETARKKNK